MGIYIPIYIHAHMRELARTHADVVLWRGGGGREQ